MAAATRVIADNGLDAPTAMIAEEAGVANGSLFTYFETKANLFNQLYLELKTELASVALDGLPAEAELREQLFHVWSNWMGLAVSNPKQAAPSYFRCAVCHRLGAAPVMRRKTLVK